MQLTVSFFALKLYVRVGYISFHRGGFHRDPRQIVQYKDLDAPDDADAF